MNPLVRTTFNMESAKKRGTDKLMKLPRYTDQEIWHNDIYTVLVNRGEKTGWQKEDGTPMTVTWLSIRRNDNQAKPDWRDFQWIKNQLVGEENEGIELYPAESRLVDSANSYHLFVFEDINAKMPLGFTHGREVIEKPLLGATQRKFPANRRPKDIEECEAKQRATIELLKNEVENIQP